MADNTSVDEHKTPCSTASETIPLDARPTTSKIRSNRRSIEPLAATSSLATSSSQQVVSMVMTPSFQTGVQNSMSSFASISPALLPVPGTVPLLSGLNLATYPAIQPSAVLVSPNTQTMQTVARQMLQIEQPPLTVAGTLQGSNVAKMSRVSYYIFPFGKLVNFVQYFKRVRPKFQFDFSATHCSSARSSSGAIAKPSPGC